MMNANDSYKEGNLAEQRKELDKEFCSKDPVIVMMAEDYLTAKKEVKEINKSLEEMRNALSQAV